MSLASVALFAGCQKNEIKEVSVEENASTFELVADIAQTKTTLDGRVVEWEEGDIIYMVTSDGTWGVPYAVDKLTTSIAEFTYAGGKFSTPATIADGSYTFNAIYSNGDQMSYHRSDKTTNQLSATQNQNCANPTAHIKKYDALVGTIEASVPMNEPAKLTMSHLYTMMQVNIVNNTDAEITVSKFEMTVADADLAGVFTVTSFATPAITAKEDEADTETITVNVTGGTVAKDATLPVYFVMAPLSDYSGNVTFKVTDSEEKTYTKTIGLSNITFEAGKYNTTPYAISEADEVDEVDYSGSWLITGTDSGKLYVATAADNGNGNNLKSTLQIAINDDKITEVDGLSDCKMTITKVTDGGTYDGMYTIKDAKGKYLYAASSSSNYLKGSTTLSKDSYWDITLNDNGTYKIVATKSSNRNIMQFNYNSGSPLVSCYSSTTTNMTPITLYPYSMVVPDLTPKIVVDATSKSSVSADGETVTFGYELRNLEGKELTVTVSDSEMLTSVVAVDGIITAVVAKNDGEARSATITLTCGEASAVALTIEQMAAPTGGGDLTAGKSYSYTFSSKQYTANGTKTLDGLSWELEGGGSYWGYDATKGQQFGSSSAPYKSMTLSTSDYVGGVEKIVINTSGAKSISGNLVVTVGGVQYGAKKSLTATATSYTFEAPAVGMKSGKIVLSYSQTSSKAIYIKSISINN